MLDTQALQSLPLAGPRRVPHWHVGADGRPVRRRAVQPAAGSDQRVAAVARRRHAPRQQLHARRRARHRPHQPRGRQSDDRVARGREGAGPHLRRGDGPHRRRRVQHDAEVRVEHFRGTAFFQTRPVWGAANNYFSQKALEVAAGDSAASTLNKKQNTSWYTPGAGSAARSRRTDVLLVRDRGLPQRLDAQLAGIVLPTAAERARRFLAPTRRQHASRDLRPADAAAVPGQLDPDGPPQPDCAQDSELRAAAAARRRRRRVQLQLAADARRSPTASSSLQRGSSSTSSPTRCR